MSEPFMGEIRMVGFNFAPQGWAYLLGRKFTTFLSFEKTSLNTVPCRS
jgi:microcystin-dependent protein